MGGCCTKQNAVVADVESDPGIQAESVSPKETTASLSLKATLPQQSEDSTSAYHSKSAVKVAFVVKPLLPAEKQRGAAECIQLLGRDTVQLPQRSYPGGLSASLETEKLTFIFDRTYWGPAVGRQLFIELTEPLLQKFLDGFNATVFAYGQTGAGKTYIMGTAATAEQMMSQKDDSVIPSALRHIFDSLSQRRHDFVITLKVSYIQIHEDSIRDLLKESVSPRAPSITLREHPTRGVFMENAREVEVTKISEVASLLEEGNTRRTVAAHKLNEFSSRSHAVLQMVLEQRRKAGGKSDPSVHTFLQSKLNLVDLAGSERAKDTGTAGHQFNEGVQINKGLLALGNVISALTQGTSRKHIPYRDSKLTRILQDSLGGTSETLMIACASPAGLHLEQSINTLRYASRARSIQNILRLNNRSTLEDEVAFLKTMLEEKEGLIQCLRQELAAARSKAAVISS